MRILKTPLKKILILAALLPLLVTSVTFADLPTPNFSTPVLKGFGQSLAKSNGIEVWYETFGHKENPAFLLIMGSCAQGILWPRDFCQKLASKGFYVIRYDHRDMGYSTCFNFLKNPYDHLDMAKDAIGLLDTLGIQKAHIFGLSAGGAIGQIIAAHFPKRVASLSLIATSCDFRPLNRALSNKTHETGSLPAPTKAYLDSMQAFLKKQPSTWEEKLSQRIDIWNLLNGYQIPLDQKSQRKLQSEFLRRLRYEPGIHNHILSNYRSEELLKEVSHKIQVPTIIFQGTKDPIFSVEHGIALHENIPGSNLYILEGHGHIPNPIFFDFIIDKLVSHAQSTA